MFGRALQQHNVGICFARTCICPVDRLIDDVGAGSQACGCCCHVGNSQSGPLTLCCTVLRSRAPVVLAVSVVRVTVGRWRRRDGPGRFGCRCSAGGSEGENPGGGGPVGRDALAHRGSSPTHPDAPSRMLGVGGYVFLLRVPGTLVQALRRGREAGR